jgi:hypothetical protein
MEESGTGRRRLLGGRRLSTALAVVMAATAAVAGPAWLAAPASAVAAPVLAEGASANNSSNFKSATATCPGDTRVYGAAFNVVNGLGEVAVNTMRPSSDLRSVLVEANELDSGISTSWQVVAQAICGPPVAGLQLRTAVVGASSATSKSVNIDCPAGQKTYSGGFIFPFGYGEVLLTSIFYGSALTRVTIQANVDDTAITWGLTGYAICGAPAPTMQMLIDNSFPIDSDTPKDSDITCPSGTFAHGYGVASGTGPDARGDIVIEDIRVGAKATLRTVTAKAYENDTTTDDWWVAAEVICAS